MRLHTRVRLLAALLDLNRVSASLRKQGDAERADRIDTIAKQLGGRLLDSEAFFWALLTLLVGSVLVAAIFAPEGFWDGL